MAKKKTVSEECAERLKGLKVKTMRFEHKGNLLDIAKLPVKKLQELADDESCAQITREKVNTPPKQPVDKKGS